MAFYGRFVRCLRVLVKPFAYLNEAPDLSLVPDPAVFVCRHRNLRGPIFTMLHLPRDVHPWVYSVFCDRKSCYKQYTSYTFSVRLKWHPFTMRMIAHLLSCLVPGLIKSMSGIAVYRKSVNIRKTFRKSVDALKRGESIIIYPDIDYVSTSNDPGKIYTGFLILGRMYQKETKKCLNFIPMDLDMKDRRILIGKPIAFNGKATFDKERQRVGEAIQKELAALGAQIGDAQV